MPSKEIETPYPLIDADPHFNRVIRYFRPSDYVAWGAITAAAPSSLYLWEHFDPTRPPRGLRSALRLATFLGAAGGFLFAYQRSSFRLWGWSENSIEARSDAEEMQKAAKEGKNPYGETDLSPYLQGVAHRNSAFSQLKLNAMPWFNFVNHSHHKPAGAQQSDE